MTWTVHYNGSYIGTVSAKTSASALRKARYQWGSSGEWTDAQLKKFTVRKSNPSGRVTKAQRREKSRKASVQRRVAVALAKFLKQANPSMKTAGASVQRLKGGVLKITPIKANASGKRRDKGKPKRFRTQLAAQEYADKVGGRWFKVLSSPRNYWEVEGRR